MKALNDFLLEKLNIDNIKINLPMDMNPNAKGKLYNTYGPIVGTDDVDEFVKPLLKMIKDNKDGKEIAEKVLELCPDFETSTKHDNTVRYFYNDGWIYLQFENVTGTVRAFLSTKAHHNDNSKAYAYFNDENEVYNLLAGFFNTYMYAKNGKMGLNNRQYEMLLNSYIRYYK